jgi:hypothetical protein
MGWLGWLGWAGLAGWVAVWSVKYNIDESVTGGIYNTSMVYVLNNYYLFVFSKLLDDDCVKSNEHATCLNVENANSNGDKFLGDYSGII